MDDAEDCRRWLRDIDRANADSGLIKDTNGNLVFVGVTNAQTWWSNQSLSK